MTTLDWTEVSRAIVADAVVGLLDAYGVATEAVSEGAPQGSSLAGVIGFTGAQMRGSIAMVTTGEVVRATQPTRTERAATRDWVAELANQLLGRIKNRMLRHGVTLDMSLPTVVTGEHIEIHVRMDSRTRYCFQTAAGPVMVSMEVQLDDDFALMEPAESAASDVMGEGELRLF